MRLFHVSEEADIGVFEPRIPTRKDIDRNIGLVWAIEEACLPNFLTPRDCPRVAYHVGSRTTNADRRRFFTSAGTSYAVAVESGWFQRMRDTTLYLYKFDTADFVLQDSAAGYYVATVTQYPRNRYVLTDLFGELVKRNVEIRITENLWDLADAVQNSTLEWSLCRMRNAAPRKR